MTNKRYTIIIPTFLITYKHLHLTSQSLPHILKTILSFILIKLTIQNNNIRIQISNSHLKLQHHHTCSTISMHKNNKMLRNRNIIHIQFLPINLLNQNSQRLHSHSINQQISFIFFYHILITTSLHKIPVNKHIHRCYINLPLFLNTLTLNLLQINLPILLNQITNQR